jgi:hypothetical protein
MREQDLVNRVKVYGWVIGIAAVLAVVTFKHFIH